MQTYNFTCPGCKKVMAVGPTLLGKNVRCPHCRQVVQAPNAPNQIGSLPQVSQQDTVESRPLIETKQPIPEFNLAPPPKEGVESIFGELADDDLFGTKPQKPIVPPNQPIPNQVVDRTQLQSQLPVNPLGLAGLPKDSSPLTLPQTNPRPVEKGLENKVAIEANRLSNEANLQFTSEFTQRTIQKPESRRAEKSTGIWTWIFLCWAIVATSLAIFFSLSREKSHPFEAIPDVYGEYEKADRKKTSWNHLPSDGLKVPEEQMVDLGRSLTMSDLEVTPLKVEFGRWDFRNKINEKFKPIPNPTFLLRLQLKNISQDVVLFPSDPAFDRRKTDLDRGQLYNKLSIGSEAFAGGLFPWPSINGSIAIVRGQEEDSNPLNPGETRETVIPSCIAPGMQTALEDNKNAFCNWRIQLRTGLARVEDGSGRKEICLSRR